jgi:hypothetical protein
LLACHLARSGDWNAPRIAEERAIRAAGGFDSSAALEKFERAERLFYKKARCERADRGTYRISSRPASFTLG